MNDTLLSVSDLEKNFLTGDEYLTVLKQVTFQLRRGELLSITGASGSGKTTLLSLIAGLDSPSRGSIRCAGFEVSRLSERALTLYRAKAVGLIFQLHYLLKDFTAVENVMIPAYMAGVPRARALERAAALLRQVDLADRADHYPMQLSGGERQRVAVARSLINEPKLILADEPTGSLDEHNSKIVEEILFSLVRAYGTSLILVTHDLALAARAGGVHRHLENGELV